LQGGRRRDPIERESNLRMVNMKKMMLVLLVAAACGGKKGADPARCKEVAAGAVDRMTGAVTSNAGLPDDAKAQMKEKGEKLKDVITKHCTEDNWSSEVLDCYAKAGTMPEIRTCRMKLPEDLAKKLQADELAVMMSGGPMIKPEDLQKRIDDLTTQLDAAQQALSNATDDAARTAAKEKVNQLQRQQFMLKQQMERMKQMTPPPGGAPAAAGSGSAQ
jgi:hypothetical protein